MFRIFDKFSILRKRYKSRAVHCETQCNGSVLLYRDHTFRYKSKKWAKFGTYFDISVMIYGISVIEYERLEYDGANFSYL